jgi:type IV pilus assembly protein PilW
MKTSQIRRQQGLTMIELMVAITLGLMILAGVSAIFVRNSRTGEEIRKANQQTENGRYASGLLADDLKNAGYLAEFDPSLLSTPSAPNPCATDLPSLKAGMAMPVQAYDNGATVPSCISDHKTGTDIIVVRRASTCALGQAGCDAAVSGAVYMQASGCNSATELSSGDFTTFFRMDTDLAQLDRKRVDCSSTPAPVYRYRVHIYFIANNYKSGDGIPTLKRVEVDPSGNTLVPLVEGIEDLQVEYGVDNVTALPGSLTGTPASYTSSPASDEAMRNVVAARLHLLARSTTPSMGYVDTRTYALGPGVSYTPSGAAAAYKRHVYETAVRINNTAGRNL